MFRQPTPVLYAQNEISLRDDALLGAPEIVVEQILEPHAGDEQEVPAVLAPLLDIFHGAVFADLAIALARRAERLVELGSRSLTGATAVVVRAPGRSSRRTWR